MRPRLAGDETGWWAPVWAHVEFARINIEPTILRKKIADLRQVEAFHSGREVQSDPACH